MTTTPSPELPDLDRLEALADAATPGIWEAQRHGVIVAGPMRQYKNGSARSQIANFTVTFHEDDHEDEPCRKQANAEFCAALRPEVVKQLIALARLAQPEGELDDMDLRDPWVVAVRKADHLCPSDLSSPDRWRWKAAYMRGQLGKPEGEAPQAELSKSLKRYSIDAKGVPFLDEDGVWVAFEDLEEK